MAKNPVFPVYYNDLIGSTKEWTDEEFGAYVRLLIHQWDKGFIPSEMFRLNKIADSAEKNWIILSEKFPAGTDFKFRNLRLEEIREEKKRHSEKQKENIRKRYQTSTKSSTNNITKKIPLEGEYEEEDERIKEREGMEGKTVGDPDAYIVPRMVTAWQKVFPKYLLRREGDFPSLKNIAFSLCDYLAQSKDFEDQNIRTAILNLWTDLIEHIKGNDHYSKYSLSQIDKYTQSILQSFNKPVHQKPSDVQVMYELYCEQGKINPKSIDEAIYDELHEKKLISVDEKLIKQSREMRLKILEMPKDQHERDLHEAYKSGNPDHPLLKEDAKVIELHAKRTAVISFFKKQKSAKAENVFIVKK